MSELDDPLFVEYMQSGDVAMAEASAIAYQHELNINANKSTANAETQKLLNERFDTPHFLVPAHSNEHVITIERPNKEYIMAVRGTRPSNVSDLISDTQILLNEPKVNRVESVEKVYKDFRAQNPNAKLTLSGHSLGSWIGHQIANKYNEDFVGFSHPASPFGLLSDNLDYNTTAKHTIYLTKNLDIISSFNKYAKFTDKIISLPQKEETSKDWLGSHDISNFTKTSKKQKTLKPRILKTKRGLNTYYSVPNAEAVRRSTNSNAANDEFANCYPGNNYEKCKKINKSII